MKNKALEEKIDDATRQLLDLVDSLNIEKAELEKTIIILQDKQGELNVKNGEQEVKLARAMAETDEQTKRFKILEDEIANKAKLKTQLDVDIRVAQSELVDLAEKTVVILRQLKEQEDKSANTYIAATNADKALVLKEDELSQRSEAVLMKEKELNQLEVELVTRQNKLESDLESFNTNLKQTNDSFLTSSQQLEVTKNELDSRKASLDTFEISLDERAVALNTQENNLKSRVIILETQLAGLQEKESVFVHKELEQQAKFNALVVEELRLKGLEKEISDREKIVLYKEQLN